jgi:hypothetical protein
MRQRESSWKLALTLRDFDMINWFTNIYGHVTVILGSSSVPPENYQVAQPSAPTVTRSNSEFTGAMNVSEERQILRIPASSTGIIGQTGLTQEYLELGEALSEMVELEEDDEWRIEEPVYTTARRIAAELMAAPYPAPRIFNHGPKSVVFNWACETNNLYLTISSNRISALLSSPESIERRIDYSVKQLLNTPLFLSSIQPDHWGQTFALIKVASDPSESLD